MRCVSIERANISVLAAGALACLSAAVPVLASGRLQAQQVVAIKIGEDGAIAATFAAQHEDPDGCGGTRTQFFIPSSHAARKEMLSLLASAQLSGARITVYVAGCTQSSNPNDVWPIVRTLDLVL